MSDTNAVHSLVLPSVYRDSAFLMKLSSRAREETGARQISAMMATPRNKELLAASGLLTPALEPARPQDLVVAIDAPPALWPEAERVVRDLLRPRGGGDARPGRRPKSLPAALRLQPDATLAIISTPGDYARFEAAQALSAGLDVLLYSDNISLADELALKRLAERNNRLLMGPDCGAAVIGGVPLGFANILAPGPVGIVASSGTGIQEVSCLLDRCGLGVAAAYGVGRRDFVDAVGGLSARAALDRLAGDAAVGVVLVIAQDPGPATRRRLLRAYAGLDKPVIIRYLGVDASGPEEAAGVSRARDLRDMALLAAAAVAPDLDTADIDLPETPPVPRRRGSGRFLRGIFSGGTLCREAALRAMDILGDVVLQDASGAAGHVFLDMGADEFTLGRPHPMLFPRDKMERITRELCDPEVGAVVTDIVLGAGTARDQAALLVRAVDEAARRSGGASRDKAVAAAVVGTERDDPPRSRELGILRNASVVAAGNMILAADWAASFIAGGRHDR